MAERPLHVRWAPSCERRCTTGVLSETVRYTDSPCQACQVSDTYSTEIHYTRQQLFSLSSRQSYLRNDVISHLKDLGMGSRLLLVRSSRRGRRKQKRIKSLCCWRFCPFTALSPGNSNLSLSPSLLLCLSLSSSLSLSFSVSLLLCLSLSPSLSLPLSFSLYLPLSLFLSLPLLLSLSLPLPLSLALHIRLSLPLFVCVSPFVSFSLSPSLPLSVSLSLSHCLCHYLSPSLSLYLHLSLTVSL